MLRMIRKPNDVVRLHSNSEADTGRANSKLLSPMLLLATVSNAYGHGIRRRGIVDSRAADVIDQNGATGAHLCGQSVGTPVPLYVVLEAR